VRGERNDRLIPSGEDIVAIGRGGDALDSSVVTRGQRRQMGKQVAAHIFLVVRGRIDVHERAREFEKIHSNQSFLDERSERKEPRGYKSGLPPLDSASSHGTDDSGQALDLPPNRRGFSYRCDFGGQLQLQLKAPFARASEADRNGKPGYSWLPHLYQAI
jgi:hypothetical protein